MYITLKNILLRVSVTYTSPNIMEKEIVPVLRFTPL